MLLTFEQLALEATGLINSNAPLPLVVSWASTLISEVSRTRKLQSFKVTDRVLYLPPTITTGLVSATRGSNTITGNAAASTAWPAGQLLSNNNYFIRVSTVWYPVGDRQGADIIIRTPGVFSENTVTNHSYILLKRYHKLDQDVETLDEHFTHAHFGSPLPVISKDQMDFLYPARWTSYSSSGGVPQHICEVELSIDQQRQVEVYPYPQQEEALYYNAWIKPPSFTLDQPLPHFINYSSLLDGLKVKLYEYEANRTNEVQAKQILLNEKARQNTIWSRSKDELILHESATSQGGLSVQLLRDRFVPTHRDINNAYSQVWSREP